MFLDCVAVQMKSKKAESKAFNVLDFLVYSTTSKAPAMLTPTKPQSSREQRVLGISN